MNTNLKNAIDKLESQIKEYRGDCLKLNEAKLQLEKINTELENIKQSDWIDTDDVPFLIDMRQTVVSDVNWYREAVDTGLYALKYAAYKVGRFRSVTKAEP